MNSASAIPFAINSVVTVCIWSITLLVQLYFVFYVLIPENAKQKQIQNFDENLQNNSIEPVYCVSYGCNVTAHKIQENLNMAVDPCSDFYDFSCGHFMSNHSFPQYQKYVNTFVNIEDRIYRQILSMVSDPISNGEPRAFSMAKSMFNTCVNVKKIDHRGSLPLLDVLYRLGGWPLLTGKRWINTNWTISEYMHNIRNEGFEMDYLFSMGVDQDPKFADKMRIGLATPTFGTIFENLPPGMSDPTVKKYSEYMMNVANRLGATGDDVEAEIQEIIQFEISLAIMSPPKFDLSKVINSYNLMTLSSIQKQYSYLQWINYINSALPLGTVVADQDSVVVLVPNFFKDLGLLLKRHNMRTVVNYLIWRVINDAIPFLSNKERLQFKLKQDQSVKKHQPRWKDCVIMTQKYLPIAVGSMYAHKYSMSRTNNIIVVQMVDALLKRCIQLIAELDWMDTETQLKAVQKLETISFEIGCSDAIMNNTNIDEYYKTLDLDECHLLESFLRINKFNRNIEFSRLNVDKTTQFNWINFANTAVANAFYIPFLNSVFIPEGVLQHEMFSSDRPACVNYGSLATVIGHEIWHAVDELGGQFDINGKMNGWWSKDTKDNYRSASKCFIDQYSNYENPATGQTLFGLTFVGENIADYIGQKLGYAAYENWINTRNMSDFILPHLEFTPKQLFWITAAQNWCCVYNKNAPNTMVKDDVHAPDRFRVMASITNLNSFSRDFKCEAGSNMNPYHKCFL